MPCTPNPPTLPHLRRVDARAGPRLSLRRVGHLTGAKLLSMVSRGNTGDLTEGQSTAAKGTFNLQSNSLAWIYSRLIAKRPILFKLTSI